MNAYERAIAIGKHAFALSEETAQLEAENKQLSSRLEIFSRDLVQMATTLGLGNVTTAELLAAVKALKEENSNLKSPSKDPV